MYIYVWKEIPRTNRPLLCWPNGEIFGVDYLRCFIDSDPATVDVPHIDVAFLTKVLIPLVDINLSGLHKKIRCLSASSHSRAGQIKIKEI